MRLSLRTKIIGSFTAIVLLALGLAVGAGNYLTRTRYDKYAYQRDLNRARNLATALSDWTAEAAQSEEMLPFPPPGPWMMSFVQIPSHETHSPPKKPMQPRKMDFRREAQLPGVDSMVLTDPIGRVLLDTAGYNGDFLEPDHQNAVLIRQGDKDVGYLYLGRMIPGGLKHADVGFFRSAGAVSWVITGIIFSIAMVAGILLSNHIVRPVKTLNEAAQDVGKGNLRVRVPETRKDELGELFREFNSMTTSLEEADEQRRRLIADSAHELRTPVSLIRARIEMMEEGIYAADAQGLSALAGESERLVHLVEELKTLTDLESPNFAPEFQTLKPAELVQEVIQSMEPARLQNDFDIELEVASQVPEIRGNRKVLYRLMSNLLTNALRHTDTRIKVTLRRADGLEILVEDDGPGIPEDDRIKVFQRYYRVDSSRNRSAGGSGLGLAIAKEIAELHGGRITAGASPKMGGALLKVELPRA